MTAPQTEGSTDLHSIIAALRQQLEEQRAERDAALAREAALAEILALINLSPGDPGPVFSAILETAHTLCGADAGALMQFDGTNFFAVATHGLPDEFAAMVQRPFRGPSHERLIHGDRFVHVEDARVADWPMKGEVERAFVERTNLRTSLFVPLRKEGALLGFISADRHEVRPFTDTQISLLESFAAQAVIAIENARLLDELRQRTAALAQRNTEYQERIEYQAATIDVLKAMSASPGDPQPVFDLITRRAQELCNSRAAGLFEYDGELVDIRSTYRNEDEKGYANYRAAFPMKPTRGLIPSRAILDKRTVHIRDMSAEPELLPVVRNLGVKSVLAVPLLRNDNAVGAFVINSEETGGFTESQVALLKTFAEQAVIAISSAETYRTLQTRTSDLQETLEYQTATSELLKVISRSTFDLQPVLATVAETAAKLCLADHAMIIRREGDRLRLTVNFGFPPEYEAHFRKVVTFPFSPAAPEAVHRAIAERQAIHIHDVAAVPGYAEVSIKLGKQRTSLGVPLLREGEPIGVIILARQRVEPFTDRQIELVSTFADQAVIAIENTRLLTEQQEALEQQTATAEVLQVINASPGNLAPVFDAMLEKALRLCDAAFGNLWTYDGEVGRLAAICGASPEYRAELMRAGPQKPEPGGSLIRLVEGEPLVHIADITAEGAHRSGAAVRRMLADRAGARTVLWVPMRKDRVLLGFFTIYRTEVRPFTDKQIALLQNFAAQAVIAMENARLITEQREALEQQTATAEVLQVINASPGDLTPVFDAILEKAHNLCGAPLGSLVLRDGEQLRAVATRGYPHEYEALARQGFSPTGPFGLLLSGEPFVHVPDAATRPAVPHESDPMLRAAVGIGGIRTALFVPLRKDTTVLGYISAQRQEVRLFTDKQIALLQNFAAQAVIAMENARLLTEQREALEQQTATAEVLQVINASPGDLAPVFDAMLERAMRLCGAQFGQLVTTADGQIFTVAAAQGPTAIVEFLRNRPPTRPGPGTSIHRVVQGERRVHIPDVMSDEAYQRGDTTRRALVDLGGCRTLVTVGLRKEDALLGAITVYRQEMRPFSEKEIALLENFAAQAVIAMENARLLTEQQEALEQQTATAEVLQVINASPGNLAPVFEAILEKAHNLCGAEIGALLTYDGDAVRLAAERNLPPTWADVVRGPWLPRPDHPVTRLIRGDRLFQIEDMAEIARTSDDPVVRAAVELGGIRSLLLVPLRKDGAFLGYITAYRQEVRPFTDKEIALLENFAAQAVIAMENARLLTELRQRTEELARRNSEYGERIEQQSATIDVLEAMSASSGDAQPVFQVIVDRARAFCNADNANLALVDGDMLHVQATTIISSSENALYMAQFPRPVDATSMFGRAILARDAVQTPDVWADPQHFQRTMSWGAIPRPLGLVAVPLLRAGAPVGAIVLARNTPGEFSATQVELLRTFGEQAVIAISSAETFKELQRRTADLTRSVAELQALEEVLRAVNSSLELETVLSTIISRAVQLSDADEGTIYEYDIAEQVFVPKSAFGMSAERVAALRERRIKLGQTHLGRSAILRAPVYVEDVQQDPSAPNAGDVLPGIHAVLAVPLLRNDTVIGGLVIRRRSEKGFAETIITLMQTFSSQAVLAIENARLFQEAGRARTAAEAALVDLRRAQDRLVQSEKMASLGQLTAGIAHEIKNPLNFVNNFAALSVDLLGELKETAAPGFAALTEKQRAEVEDVSSMLTSNLEKITEHGKRADGIVKAMLEHSRGSSGERRMVDLNVLIDEALNLAYHGARAQDQTFNITLERDFGEGIVPIEINPQDITRVFLNLFANGFYATTRRARDGGDACFVPTLKVTTIDAGEAVEIRVRDNGTGIPADIRDKLFQPFFTTKPTGEGTGLGLSITYDIVTQQHGGSIAVDSKVGDYSEFTIRLPRKP